MEEITIDTQLGQITGLRRTIVAGNATVYDFRKIPFAKAHKKVMCYTFHIIKTCFTFIAVKTVH
jgi:hypothetical protein